MTPDGQYVVTKMEKDAYDKPKMERPPFLPPLKVEEEDDEELPDELTCPICNDLIQVCVWKSQYSKLARMIKFRKQ